MCKEYSYETGLSARVWKDENGNLVLVNDMTSNELLAAKDAATQAVELKPVRLKGDKVFEAWVKLFENKLFLKRRAYIRSHNHLCDTFVLELRLGKPHIVFVDGHWRVSPWKKEKLANYNKANIFIAKLNRARISQ